MSELPDRPDLDQLRRQARELLRAAAAGEPHALTRLRAVSDRVTLSAVQLAVAREYGCRSWAALKDEVERRRRLPGPAAGQHQPGGEWRSFAGADVIDVAAGALFPEALLVGPGRAVLTAGMIEPSAPESFRNGFDDVTIVDDRGARYALRYEHASRSSYGPLWLRLLLEPTPGPGVAWIELRGQHGSATRLLPSPRPAMRIGQPAPVALSPAERELTERALILIRLYLTWPDKVFGHQYSAALARAAQLREADKLDPASPLPDQLARLCAALAGPLPADGIPTGWSAMLDAARRADGPRHHLGLEAELPPLGDVAVQVASLVSGPGDWRLYLRAMPAWWQHSEDHKRRWTTISVQAEDDLGGLYVSGSGGGTAPRQGQSGHEATGHEEVTLTFLPRLDPLARALTLTFQGASDEVAIDLSLPPAASG